MKISYCKHLVMSVLAICVLSQNVYANDSVTPSLVNQFNDPLIGAQKEYFTGLNKINDGMTIEMPLKRKPRISVLSTGFVPHQDLKIAGGRNFYTVDGDKQNDDFYDNWDNGNCVSGEGNVITGILSAIANNNVGIVGMLDADVYMAKVAKPDCVNGGNKAASTDIVDAINWSLGRNNDNKISPVDVIYIASTIEGACSSDLQGAIDGAVDFGVTVVSSAPTYRSGESDLSTAYAPLNCNNVIVVGQHTSTGGIPNNATTGSNINFSAVNSMYSTNSSNGYDQFENSVVSGALVTGAIAKIKASFFSLNNEDILNVIKEKSIGFPENYQTGIACQYGCGNGLFNVEGAINLARQVFEPTYDFHHSLPITDNCEINNQFNSISSYVDACNITVSDINVGYFNAINYQFKLFKRAIGTTPWVFIKSLTPDSDLFSMIIDKYNPSEYEYAISSCDGDNCLVYHQLDKNQILTPPQCN